MLHSTVTSKGQTTIPGAVRQALNIRPGDRIEYALEGDCAVIRVHPGTKMLAGALSSTRGRGLSLAQIREAAVKAARRHWESR
jgi:antitoxin PrlF